MFKKLNYTHIFYFLLALVAIIFVMKYFNIPPFTEEYRNIGETCYKTCINTSSSPTYIKTSLLNKNIIESKPIILPVPSAPTFSIPSAPMLTGNSSVIPPSPPILIDKKLDVPPPMQMDKSVVQDKRAGLLDSIRQGMKLKKVEQQKQAEIASNTIASTPSTNPLLDQIRQGVQLKKASASPLTKPAPTSGFGSLQDEISKKLASRRKVIADETDEFDEYFRFLHRGYY